MLDENQRHEALVHFQRGLVLERAHRVREAVEEYRRALAYDPHLREAHGALGLYYQRNGLLAKAAEEFRAVARLEDDFLSHFNLGYILLELQRLDEAQAAFRRCLELEPGDPAAHYELGYIHFLRAEYADAIGELQHALKEYPEDWEVQTLIGRCYLRLGSYEAAHAAFSRALHIAARPQAQAEIVGMLEVVERYRELQAPYTAKDRLYAEHGVVILGSATDDGLRIEEAGDYHFTYPDIGVTLRRLLALAAGCGWSFTCVVALDRLATPLAAALAEVLDVPQRATHDVQPGDLPLLVMAVGREAELLELAVERIPGGQVTFCLGLNWLRRASLLPDIVGIVAREACSVPWEPELRRLRSDGAAPERIATCLADAAARITAAARDTTPDPNIAQQIAYYAEAHVRVRFGEVVEIAAR
jgi:tetratricopeptide (TPR) repeat protein